MVGTDVAPFGKWGVPGETDDSLNNAAAMHHKPGTFLQWVVAAADRVSSGFERSTFDAYNAAPDEGHTHYTARLLTQFEQLNRGATPSPLAYAYPLTEMTAASLAPVQIGQAQPESDAIAKEQYAQLWQRFVQSLAAIPPSLRAHLPQWLDAFDSAWLCFTHAIPSATAGKTVPDVSLYDHSKATAAFAAAIWRYHNDNGHDTAAVLRDLDFGNGPHGWGEQKILLIQGDFFGIQNYVFGSGSQTQKFAAKLLRGRSFSVALLTELAALQVLEALELPSTSQIVNAAGKFLIVAPNTAQTHAALVGVRARLEQWFARWTLGQQGIGLAEEPASLNDFKSAKFKSLLRRLGDSLETQKLSRHGLCSGVGAASPVVTDYLARSGERGVCSFDGRLPAERDVEDPDGAGYPASALAHGQIALGDDLTKKRFAVIEAAGAGGFDWLGYRVTLRDALTTIQGTPVRVWDFARRFVNSYVPMHRGELTNFEEIADSSEGLSVLGVLKGDVDNLGALFADGLKEPTFAKWAGLSRQLHAFFAVRLPMLCASDPRFAQVYTVFAGGDDFFLIGPWDALLDLAGAMRTDFGAHVAHNPRITFSAGMVLAQSSQPIRRMADAAEEALAAAKGHVDGPNTKDALHVFGRTVTWKRLTELRKAQAAIEQFCEKYEPSSGYIYGLLQLAEQAQRTDDARRSGGAGNTDDWLWRARFGYRTQRVFKKDVAAAAAFVLFGGALHEYKADFRVALSAHLYRRR
jgi:CRISPR-associated protein Csm1